MAGVRWHLWKGTMAFFLLVLQLGFSLVLGQDIQFTRSIYNATIAENSPIRTFISTEQKMGIYLPDPSVTVRYSLQESDVSDLFSARPEVVGDFAFLRIRTRPCRNKSQCPNLKVNREVRPEYYLTVIAQSSSGGERSSATAEVHIVVKDVNEQPPLFLRGNYAATVREDYPVFSNIIQVEAHDSDSGINGEVYYSFRQQTDQFAIHTTTGVVSLTRPLDFDQRSSYALTVVAKDRGFTPYGGVALTSSVQLRIYVEQVNKHSPEVRVEKQPTVSRNSEVGTVFAVVGVTDEDGGANGEIASLDIIDGDPGGFFRVEPSSTPGRYQLKIANSLLTSNLPHAFNVTVAASDRGSSPRTTSLVVGVVLDGAMNFEAYFTSDFFNTTISELMPVNTPFLSVAPRSAIGNTGFSYVIQDPSLPFSIGTHTGMLSVAVDLDRETTPEYDFTVAVRNSKQQTIADTRVLVILSDANDNNPSFEEELYTVEVEENRPVNYQVLVVRASDPDHGENGFISYSIANMNPVPFTIDHQTGSINTSKVLDYETMRHQYRLRVRASDWGAPFRREAEAVVVINLINLNDNRPKFEKINCVGAIAKSFPSGRAIALISALDFDDNRPRYWITSGNVNDLFSINTQSGNLTLSRPVADSDPLFYSLRIEARDGPTSVSYMRTNMSITNNANPNPQAHARGLKVTCQETDVAEEIVGLYEQLQASNQEVEHLPPNYAELYSANVHEPEFETGFRTSVAVPEDSPVSSTVLTVNANDLDHGFNGKLLYAISDGNDKSHFQMDFETGELKVLMPLDRETQSVYDVTVKVADMGRPQHTRKSPLTITLTDVNDNAPHFDLKQYDVNIPEDAEVGLRFLAVHASDRDEGRNQEVRYSIISDSPSFDIDIISGELSVAGPLDRETIPIHEVRVQATDLSDSPLSTSVIVRVSLDDINDNPPQCLLPENKVKIREDLPTGAAVLSVQAHDPDNPPNGTVHYRLDNSGPSKFSIDTDYGTLRLVEMLDYEETQLYEIVVAIRDEGIPAMSSTCRIVVEVVDVNENTHAPVFQNYVLTGSVHEGHINDTEVMTITAADMDMGIDGEVSYTIRDGSGLGRFSIDNAGVIRATEELDRESTPHYWLTIYAQDHGAIPLHSVVQVFIEVLDINDNAPLPTQPVFRAEVPENSPMGVYVLTVEAVDPDTSSSGNLTYRLKTNSAKKYFTIDERTGVISTASKALDREAKRGDEHHFEEVADITKEYEKKNAEEITKDILGRSKGCQYHYSAKKFHRRVGIRIWRRSCKVQVKPITISRGKQVNLPRLMAEVCDAVTQTEEIVVLPPPVNSDEGPASELDEPEPEDEPEEDDESKDPTYIPSEETNSPCKERPPALSQPKSPLEEQKFIVFETNLLELFQVCLSCLSRNMNVEKVCPHTYGSAMKVVATCLDCGHRRDWQSQPKVGDVMAGNFILAAAILFGGGSPTKFLRILKHMNLKAITVETFMKHQRETLQPAIIRVAKEEQRKVIQEIPEGEGLVLGGDGRADSPGHCAKYGAYTLMDLKRNKIVDVQLVQSNEVRNSNAMEKEGLRRGLAKLEELNVRVDTLVTDRHAQVAKWLRENYPEITHKYDVWHIAKGLLKKISAIAKLKDCEVLGRWKKSINNHVYWCASSTPDGDGDIIVAKFQSILNHIRNVHENHGELYPSCSHGEDYERREWMTQGSKAFDKLSQELSKTRLKNDMKKMSPLAQTSSVEAFHSVMLYWCPKMLAYSYAGIKCRLAIAALHWNENAGRSHATKADGTPMYKINYPKAKEGGHTVSRVLTNCTYNYVTLLMEETMKLVSEKQKIRSTIPELEGKPPLCSGVERPDKAEAVQRLNEHRRFIHQ